MAVLVVELVPEITARARALLQRHELRAGDAIQLASCLYLEEQFGEEIPLLAFDNQLTKAARREGLRLR